MPCSRHDLERLPGVGPYTASVVMVEVFGLQEPFVDVNMSRVLSRFFGTQTCATSSGSASLYTLAFHLVSCERCLSVNWAVLDFAALVCRARSPLCQECLLWKECQFVKGGTASLDGG
jgi:A/G-specific adenine glycosylase